MGTVEKAPIEEVLGRTSEAGAALVLLDVCTPPEDGSSRYLLTLCNGEADWPAAFDREAARRSLQSAAARMSREGDCTCLDSRGVWVLLAGANATVARQFTHRLQRDAGLEIAAVVERLSPEEAPGGSPAAGTTDVIATRFRCPESGAMVECSLKGWDVVRCSGRGWSPLTGCDQHCVKAVRQGLSLATTWSAEHAEPSDY